MLYTRERYPWRMNSRRTRTCYSGGGRSQQKSRHFHYLESKCVTTSVVGGFRRKKNGELRLLAVHLQGCEACGAEDVHACAPDGSPEMYLHTLSTFFASAFVRYLGRRIPCTEESLDNLVEHESL